MVFNSLTFLLFFAVVVAFHHSPIHWKGKKAGLLVASYLFYAAWNPVFVLLLWISTIVDWMVARRMGTSESNGARKAWMVVSLGTNLGMLSVFKYGDFLLGNLIAALAALGVHYAPPDSGLVLPVGISFYTFQTLSYTLDVYRKELKPWPSFLDFALFVTFFPQLVAGPIVRAANFLPQLVEQNRASPNQLGWGLALLLLGLFEKVVLADSFLAPVADLVYAVGAGPGFVDSWIGTLAFSGQIYFDFAGYSSSAIGAAMILGFALPDNFRGPYGALGFSDFWRKWHISLSSWLRDYLYVSLGGNRKGSRRTQINLMLTMLLGGLWHGASWTFVVWGALHGVYLSIERVVSTRLTRIVPLQNELGVGLGIAVTYVAICYAWVFFRAPDFPTAWHMVQALSGMASGARPIVSAGNTASALAIVGGMLLGHVTLRGRSLESIVEGLPNWARVAILAFLLTSLFTSGGGGRAFIYFQF